MILMGCSADHVSLLIFKFLDAYGSVIPFDRMIFRVCSFFCPAIWGSLNDYVGNLIVHDF